MPPPLLHFTALSSLLTTLYPYHYHCLFSSLFLFSLFFLLGYESSSSSQGISSGQDTWWQLQMSHTEQSHRTVVRTINVISFFSYFFILFFNNFLCLCFSPFFIFSVPKVRTSGSPCDRDNASAHRTERGLHSHIWEEVRFQRQGKIEILSLAATSSFFPVCFYFLSFSSFKMSQKWRRMIKKGGGRRGKRKG